MKRYLIAMSGQVGSTFSAASFKCACKFFEEEVTRHNATHASLYKWPRTEHDVPQMIMINGKFHIIEVTK